MTTAPDPDLHRLALAVERLDGTMQTGFATVRGDINLLARAEQHNREHIADLETEVEKLKGSRFPWPVIMSVCSVGALALSGFSMVGRA